MQTETCTTTCGDPCCSVCFPEPPIYTFESAPSGAIRSKLYPQLSTFPIRLDLLFTNPIALRRLGETFGEGSLKYSPHNWKKGFPESVFLSHALEHLRLRASGDTTEDHLAHACWNLMALMHFEETDPSSLDLTNPS